jgi:signal transduction histidine kinase
MEKNLKDKPFFVVALLASFLAFGVFKDELKLIYVNFGLFKLSILVLLIIFYLVLALSIYFFSINLLLRDEKWGNNLLTKLCYSFGNLLYAVAIVLPPVFLLAWLISLLLNAFGSFISSKSHGILDTSTSLLLLLCIVIVAIKSAIESFQEENRAIKKYEKLADEKMERTLMLNRKGFYSEAIVFLCSSLEFNLRRRLVEKGFSTGDRSYKDLIDLARKKKIISEQGSKILLELINNRNRVIRYGEDISKDKMDEMLLSVKGALLEINNYKL